MNNQPKIFINHLGYHPQASKKLVIESQQPLTEFQVCNQHSDIVYTGELVNTGPVDQWQNWLFWQGDFSAVCQPGQYQIVLPTKTESIQSPLFTIQANLLPELGLTDLLFYFKSQRSSGAFDHADRTVPFVGNRTDRVDVHGGWYDASGDTSKYLSHLSYTNYMNPQQTPLVVWAMLQALAWVKDSPHERLQSLASRLQEEALFGADFLMRMQAPAGYFYMVVFDQWTKELDQREICAFETRAGHKYDDYQAGYRQGGGITIAALARASILATAGNFSDFSATAYLQAAETGFAHLQEHNLTYLNDGQENIIDDYCALLAATELYRATKNGDYLNAARQRKNNLLHRISDDDQFSGWWRADDTGDRPYCHAAEAGLPVIALLRYLEVSQDQSVLIAIERSLAFELAITRAANNPFGYARQYVKGLNEAKRSAFFGPHQNESGYWWQGENARLASLATAALWATKYVERDMHPDLSTYASDQLNWIFGLNPYDMCMLQGQGRNNPDYRVDFPNAPGGVCNGITAGFNNEHDIAFKPPPHGDDPFENWRWGEQWIPHGAWLLLALAALADRDF